MTNSKKLNDLIAKAVIKICDNCGSQGYVSPELTGPTICLECEKGTLRDLPPEQETT